jgi:hypothetical protein
MTHTHEAPASVHSSTEPQTFVSVAVRRAWTGDMGCAEQWLRYLDGDDLRHACTVLRRVAVLAEAIRFEGLAQRVVASQGYMVTGPAGSAHGAPDWRDE